MRDGFKPPFPLPSKKTQTGYKTRSTKNGSAGQFQPDHVRRREGQRLVDMQAEKDLKLLVNFDRTVNVRNDHTETIGNNAPPPSRREKRPSRSRGDMTTTVKMGNSSQHRGDGQPDQYH